MRVAILGKHGDLANAVATGLSDHYVCLYGQEDFNFADKKTISNLVDSIHDFDAVIVCSGIVNNDSWDSLLVNFVGPAYLLELLVKKSSHARVIIIGSHSATWISWPGIDLSRLSYNVGKQAIEKYTTALEHSGISRLQLTVFHPTRFKSKLSQNTGLDISDIVEIISELLLIKNPPLIYELGSFRDDE